MMRDASRERSGRLVGLGTVAGLVLGAASLAAQQPKANPPGQGQPRTPPALEKKADAKAKGGLRLPAGDRPADLKADPADPLAPGTEKAEPAAKKAVRVDPAAPVWPYHFTLRISAYDGTPMAVRYYPSRQGGTAPVVLLIHEAGAGRSGKDFEEPIGELKNLGLAAYLQGEGYAVLVPDLRGHGANPRKTLSAEQWRSMTYDLQAAYHFLIDRNNRRELNLGKLGVVGVGEGANLVAAWAATPGGAVSVEGRLADLAALALVSPLAEDRGLRLAPAVATLAPRFPLLVMAGQRDAPSAEAVKAVQPTVERQREGRVALIEARQHGANLLRFAPDATAPLLRFLDNALRARTDEWEPRYNLDPVAFANVQVVESKEAPAVEAEPEDEPAPAKKKVEAGKSGR